MAQARVKFTLKGRPGAQIDSIVIRETDGKDEKNARDNAEAKSTEILSELIKLSIDEVDGKPAKQPFEQYERWNTKTRGYVLAAFKSLNYIEDKDVTDFLAKAEVVPSVALVKDAIAGASSGENG